MVGFLQSVKGLWKYSVVCLPKKADVNQTKDVVVKYLIDHPAERTRPAAQLIIHAMLSAWACPVTD
jgi:hypothetical protein